MDQPANPPTANNVSRIVKRSKWIVTLILKCVVIGAIAGCGTQIGRRERILSLQNECLKYVAPTDKPLDNWSAPNRPKPVIDFMAAINHPLPPQLSVLFCHEIRATTGQRFLVLLILEPNGFDDVNFTLGDLFHDPTSVVAKIENIDVHPNDAMVDPKASASPAEYSKFIPKPPPPGADYSAGQLDPHDSRHYVNLWAKLNGGMWEQEIWLGPVDSNGILHKKLARQVLIP